jgi:hypothetical protein
MKISQHTTTHTTNWPLRNTASSMQCAFGNEGLCPKNDRIAYIQNKYPPGM